MNGYPNAGMDVYETYWEELTKNKAFEGYLPETVCVSLCLREHLMCIPTVKVGESILKGQIIGRLESTESGCVYASISGTVKEIFYIQRAPGVLEPFVKIQKIHSKRNIWFPFSMKFDKDSILKLMIQMGMCEMERSGVKICAVNGFCNEPYITSGYRLIMESPGKIVLGAMLAAQAMGADHIYVCVNEDAVDAISRLNRSIQKYGKRKGCTCSISVLAMKHRYPFGNVQMIEKMIAKKEKGGMMVFSLAQMAALYDGIYDGEPWTKVGVTVSGKVAYPKNLWVPIGTNIKELVEFCGGIEEDTMIIHGGPFAGHTTDGENSWVGRDTTGIIVLTLKDLDVLPCVRCGMCRDACPQNLCPDKIEKNYLSGCTDFKTMAVDRCIQCGLCSYVCPSGRRLTEYVGQVKKGRFRKQTMEKNKRGNYIDVSENHNVIYCMNHLKNQSQSAPHIHHKGTIQDVMRMSLCGIIPLILGVIFKYPDRWLHVLSMILIGGLSAGLAEYFWQINTGRFLTVHDGSAAFSGVLLALLFESETSLLRVVFAAVFSIIVGKQLFGGIGHAPFHPAILGKLIFQPTGMPMVEPLWYLALVAVFWMLFKQMQPWWFSLIYVCVSGIFVPKLFTSAVFYLAAVYFVWSYETMPPTNKDRWVFTWMITISTIVFCKTGLGSVGICFAAGLANGFIPWMRERYDRCS